MSEKLGFILGVILGIIGSAGLYWLKVVSVPYTMFSHPVTEFIIATMILLLALPLAITVFVSLYCNISGTRIRNPNGMAAVVVGEIVTTMVIIVIAMCIDVIL